MLIWLSVILLATQYAHAGVKGSQPPTPHCPPQHALQQILGLAESASHSTWKRLEQNFSTNRSIRAYAGSPLASGKNFERQRAFYSKMGLLDEDLADQSPQVLRRALIRYQQGMAEHVRRGRIAAQDIPEPGFIFSDPSGNKSYVAYGSPLSRRARPWTQLLSDDEFFSALSLGKSPMVAPEPLTGELAWTAADHGWSHLGAFLDHPEYGASIIQAARRYKDEFLRMKGEPKQRFISRVWFTSESLSLVPRTKRGDLLQLFGEPFTSDPNRLFKVSELEHLKRYSMEHLEALARKIVDSYPGLIEDYGGASRDLMFSFNLQSPNRREFNPLGGLIADLKDRGWRDLPEPERRLALASLISRVEVGLFNSTHIPAHEFVTDLLRPAVSKKSPTYRFLCGSGVWPTPSRLFQASCLDLVD